jgi:hypothetical protein
MIASEKFCASADSSRESPGCSRWREQTLRPQAEVSGDIRKASAPETRTTEQLSTPSVYGMLMPPETEYLRVFASKDYSGQGAIVDLGCWFGVSTVTLATGLREHPDLKLRSTLVHAYDLFIWDAWMDDDPNVHGTPLHGKYKPGDSFLEECLRLTEPWKENIKFYPGDLSAIGWSGGPIEFLFIDAMKSWQLANSIIHDFYPSLIPGSSVVIQQDFRHFYAYWIHLITYRFREYFHPVYDIPYAGSLVFKYVKQIPDPLLRGVYDLSSFSNDEIDAAFEYAKRLVGQEKQAHIAVAKLRCYTEKGDRQLVEGTFFELSDLLYRLVPYTIVMYERSRHEKLAEENDRLHMEVERLHELERELCNAKVDLGKAQSELGLARSRISAMESSKFWKLRHQWFRVKRALHLPGWETE